MGFDRPTATPNGFVFPTPSDATMAKLLGASQVGGVGLSNPSIKRLMKAYGYEEESDPLMKAGMFRNLTRDVEVDGVRLMSVLAPYLEKDQDPVKLLIQVLVEAGIAVSNDVDWAFGEED